MNKEYKIKNNRKGFVALITAIILSLILIIITVTLNQSGFFTRSIILDSEYKERSVGLAEACVDVVILKLASNPAYDGVGEPDISIGSDKCSIRPIAYPSPSERRIETRAKLNGATTNLCVIVNKDNLAVLSWNEVPSFPCM